MKLIIQISILFIHISLIGCNNKRQLRSEEKTNSIIETSYSYKVFQSLDSSWGFDLIDNGKILIHQSIKPALSGNKGFSKNEYAEEAAQLMIKKMENGIMPPSLSADEVKTIIGQ